MSAKKNETYCSVCGFVIPTNTVGAKLDCEGVDFNSRMFVDVSLIICTECWLKIDAIALGGMTKAIKRSKMLVKANDTLQ